MGEAIKRIEEREGEGIGGEEAWKEKEGERLEGKPWKEGVKGGEGRVMRRGGRVSNSVKTLEQGAKQGNKRHSYFTKFGDGCGMGRERGHSLCGGEKTCGGIL